MKPYFMRIFRGRSVITVIEYGLIVAGITVAVLAIMHDL